MKKIRSKSVLIAVLCLSFVLAILPTAVFAENSTGEDPIKENSWRYKDGELIDSRMNEFSTDDNSTDFGISLMSVPYKHGIDVSHHQGTIDWSQVKNDVDFAIIRCGYGQDRTTQDDTQWSNNVDGCIQNNIPYGVYLYSYATTVDAAASEAQHVLRLVSGHSFSMPIYLDMEDSTQLSLSAELKGQIADTFCSAIQSAGYKVGIYANKDWWTNQLTNSAFNNSSWYKWVAQYNSTCTYSGRYDMWQYSSTGSVSGISGNVDMNYLYTQDIPDDDDNFSYPIYAYINSPTERSTVYEELSSMGTYYGQIFVDDKCTIDKINMADGWIHVTYPVGTTTKLGYVYLSDFIPTEYKLSEIYQMTAGEQTTTYRKSDMAVEFGYADEGDTLTVIGKGNGKLQVIYPIDAQYGGGYKMGWIYDKTIPKTLTEIKIVTKPLKLIYTEGEDINLDGLHVYGVYSDGSTVDVTSQCSTNGYDSSIGIKTIKVTYSGYETEFTIAVKGAEKNFLCGDINGDGAVNNKDLTRMFQYLSDWNVEVEQDALDTNGDGSVNNKDLTRLFQYLSDWDVTLGGNVNKITTTSFVYGKSELNRDLVCYSISPQKYDKTILLNFAIHGFEDNYAHDGQILVNTANNLIDYYSKVSDLNNCRLLIIPSANPDGLVDGTTKDGFGRCNAKGIDLNRDFDANYIAYSTPRNYTQYAFSGAESKALRDLCLESNPDIVIDFHGWESSLIGDTELKTPFNEELGLRISSSFTSTNANGYFSNWAHQQGALAMLVEFTSPGSIDMTKLESAINRIIADE